MPKRQKLEILNYTDFDSMKFLKKMKDGSYTWMPFRISKKK